MGEPDEGTAGPCEDDGEEDVKIPLMGWRLIGILSR